MDMDQLLASAGQFKTNLDQAKKELEKSTLEIKGGKGLISLTVNGFGKAVAVEIAKDSLSLLGKEQFEQALLETFNLAAEKSRQMASKIMERSIGFDLDQFNNLF